MRGLLLPIDGAEITTTPELLPNSPREYRAGWHEGIDFAADRGTPVRAAAAGTVVRVDREFVDWDPAALNAALEAAIALGYTPDETLDYPRTPGLDRSRPSYGDALRASRRGRGSIRR